MEGLMYTEFDQWDEWGSPTAKEIIKQLLRKTNNENMINPDKYRGTDIQKVQSSINECLDSKGSKYIVMSRIYNLNGGTIKINRGDTRYPTYIMGGGFIKTNGGFMFSSDIENSSDIYFTNVCFKSNAGSGVKVFNFDKLIRVHTTNCHFRDVDCIGYCGDDDKYVQSYRSMGDTVFGGNGYAYDFAGVYDTVFSKLTLEQRDSGIRVRGKGIHGTTYGLTIEKSVLEGLSGTAIYLNGSLSTNIDDNYFEANKQGHIVFSETSHMKGVSITRNKLFGAHSDGYKYLVKWGKTAHSVTSEGNISTYKGIHDASLIKDGFIFSKNDSGNVSVPDLNHGRISYQSTVKYESYNDSVKGTKSFMGVFNRLTSSLKDVQVPPNKRTTFTIPFNESIRNDDLISIQVYAKDKDITLMNYYRTGTNVIMNVKSAEPLAVDIDIVACVLKGYYSVTG
ncbi:right-handed parallel beta-helix repeat-containing protein [Bacillus toyonensis]|uniref:right-handed parallel beta-helix repeat-containing protein n=1 Tax=Bacillus toyonensis TaxID=155322 RepID=UPI003D222D4C